MYYDDLGIGYVNLTCNDILVSYELWRKEEKHEDIIIPRSGQNAYVAGKSIIGLPPQTNRICYIVEYSVLRLLDRIDLCLYVIRDTYTKEEVWLVPITDNEANS